MDVLLTELEEMMEGNQRKEIYHHQFGTERSWSNKYYESVKGSAGGKELESGGEGVK
jgi:hypothetical protein